jgi:uncharacterized membrane protein YfcA
MEFETILGYTGAFLAGLILGLLGGGGALLAIPVLFYLFHVEASLSTGYSLFLVAITASSGAVQNIRKNRIDYDAAFYYGIPSVISIYLVRRFLIPNLPQIIFTVGKFPIDKNHFILFILSVVMFAAAFKMIGADGEPEVHKHRNATHHIFLIFYAVLIGGFLGLVGTGGGFLIVPALIYFANVSTKKAIGTSLVLVAANSFMGFLGDISSSQQYNWPFLLSFSAFSVIGVLAGHRLANYIEAEKLKKYFGWFILFTALYIVVKELFMK